MERTTVLTLLVTVLVGLASSECLDGNCTDQQLAPLLHLKLASIFPMIGPVDINNKRNRFDDAIDPLQPTTNVTDSPGPPEDIISINFMEVISLNGEENSAEDPQSDKIFPDIFSMLFKQNSFIDVFGILDLSGLSLTGDQLTNQLRTRLAMGQPITSLILSNTRIEGMTISSFQPVEESLQELRMDNCSVNLDALVNLSNLRLLNLSNTGLSTLQWYPKLRDSLQVLDLSHNLFDEVRPELSVLTSLKELDLSYNRISSVKEFPLVLLPNLEILSLTMNSLADATFTGLLNLKRLEVDWNYLWRCGQELQLPSHSLQVKLASNPWRCDCGLLEGRDNNDVLDIDTLQCADRTSFAVCDGCQRYFLPLENGLNVSHLTLESVDYLGCTGLVDQLSWLQEKVADMRPETQLALGLTFCGCLVMLFAVLATCRKSCTKKQLNKPSWLSQQTPYLKIDKLTKQQEIPYIKI